MKTEHRRETLDTNGAATYLHRTPGSIRNLVMRQKIPFRKPGGRLIFFIDELDAWIEEAPGITLDDIRKDN